MNLIGYIVAIYRSLPTLATNQNVNKKFDELRDLIQQVAQEDREFLKRILDAVDPPPAASFVFTVDVEGKIFEGETKIPMTNSQKATARIKPVGTGGRPAVLDGVPVWASADETLAAVVASDDGLSAEITPTGPIGTVRVTVTGDADLGQGVTPIFGTLDVDITAGTAVGIEVTLDAPVEQ
jgi:hypothetical protein